jgi:hypothetical protein
MSLKYPSNIFISYQSYSMVCEGRQIRPPGWPRTPGSCQVGLMNILLHDTHNLFIVKHIQTACLIPPSPGHEDWGLSAGEDSGPHC